MSVEFKLPKLNEAISRLDSLLMQAFVSSEHPAIQDWLTVRFALKELETPPLDRDVQLALAELAVLNEPGRESAVRHIASVIERLSRHA
jgi:hypothetical protein